MALLGVAFALCIFLADLRQAHDAALAARLGVIAQDIRVLLEAQARLGVKLRYLSELQTIIEAAQADNPGLAAITVRSEGGGVLASTDGVVAGAPDAPQTPQAGWTRVDDRAVAVGVPVVNSFGERLGDVEVSALRGGMDRLHLQPLRRVLAVAAVFLLLGGALAALGTALVLEPLRQAVRRAQADATGALALIGAAAPDCPRDDDARPNPGGPLQQASTRLLGLVQQTRDDLARLDEAEG